jgi:hypothetical protein
MLDKKLYVIPARIADKEAAIENMNRTVQGFHPEYWEARQTRLSAETKPQTLAERLEAGKAKAAAHIAPGKTPDVSGKSKNATEH